MGKFFSKRGKKWKIETNERVRGKKRGKKGRKRGNRGRRKRGKKGRKRGKRVRKE